MKAITATLGTVYLPRPECSKSEMAGDFDCIKEAGLATVTIWPALDWYATDLPEPSLVKTLEVLGLCEERNLGCIVELFGQNPGQELLPDYLMKEEYLVDMASGHILPWFDATRTFLQNSLNFNHPEVAKIIDDNLKFCVEGLKGHDALIAWDLFNETNFISYDKWTLDCFREWLKNKYKTIYTFNRAWERTYRDFTEIIFDSQSAGYSTWATLVPRCDMEEFRIDNLSCLLSGWRDRIKELDPEHPVIIDNAGASPLIDNRQRGTDDSAVAEIADIYGTTYYPVGRADFSGKGAYLKSEESYCIAALLAAARSASGDKSFVVSELQTHGQSFLTPLSNLRGIDISHFTWQAIAGGAESVTYWKWRPFMRGGQISSRGLTDGYGKPTERLQAACEIAKTLKKHHKLFASAKKPSAKVAIISSPLNQALMQILEKPDYDPRYSSFLGETCLGYYRLFMSMGIETDFILMENLSLKLLSHYDCVVIPSLFAIDESHIESLIKWVHKGGTLIAEGRVAAMDSKGFAYPQSPHPDLAELLGASVMSSTRPGVEIVLDKGGELKGGGMACCQLKVDNSAKIIDSFKSGEHQLSRFHLANHPAIIHKETGQGNSYYSAFEFGYGAHFADENEFLRSRDALRPMLPESLLTSVEILKNEGPVEVHLRENESGALLFILNHCEEEQEVSVKIAKQWHLKQWILAESKAEISQHNILNIRLTGMEVAIAQLNLTIA